MIKFSVKSVVAPIVKAVDSIQLITCFQEITYMTSDSPFNNVLLGTVKNII